MSNHPPSSALQSTTPVDSAGPWRPWTALSQPLSRWWHQRSAPAAQGRCLSLALQGGGAHGAFTWGVLDALLEEPSIDFAALSGSSAGAVNAVLLTQGWIEGGRDGARSALNDFWLEVGQQIPWPLVTQGQGDAISLTAAVKALTQWVGLFAPGQINPLGLNPLRDLLQKHISFERIRSSSPFQLFVGATEVNTGRLRLFREHELELDMLLASACLPKMHHTVEIAGEPYWDGGYCANPAVFPLLQGPGIADVLLILLSPQQQDPVGTSMQAIEARIQELGFTTHFLREMQMLAQAASTANRGRTGQAGAAVGQARFHLIDANQLELLRRSETQVLAYAPFLEMIKQQGRERARHWLANNLGAVGQRSTMDWSRWA
jgi:NTE family protein